MSKNTGGPAFPGADPEFIDHPVHGRTSRASVGMEAHPGMSLRDYFAAQALAGWMASDHAGGQLSDGTTIEHFRGEMARNFYTWADAMLAERARDGDT